MELRKDPITRSWVVAGHPEQEKISSPEAEEIEPGKNSFYPVPVENDQFIRLVFDHLVEGIEEVAPGVDRL